MKRSNGSITDDTRISQIEGLDTTDLDGEKVMMDLIRGAYFMLNDVGTKIWDMIKEVVSIREIVDSLLDEYDVEEEECKNEVIEFIQQLEQFNLINIIEK